ncbi:MAG: alanine racemase [Chromatiales bacterium]|nr:MAG: alanine racemase [Chromatiales bacterium]
MSARSDRELCDGPLTGGRLTVDLDALAANFAVLTGLAAPARCAAVVKANAYGLGLEPVARKLDAAGCDCYFVANLAEALTLRAILPVADIYVFEGSWPGQEAAFVASELRPVINTLEQFERWAALPAPAPCALQVDTGMSRLGLSLADARQLAARGLGQVAVDYLVTHLACADEPGHAVTPAQLTRFDEARVLFPGLPTSLGNTAGITQGEATRGDLVRAGIGLYGGNPSAQVPNPFHVVANLEGRVLQVREVGVGATVGYGAEFRVRETARLATLGLGYADGYPRSLGNRGYAVVDGHRLPVVGRISMDSLVIDVTSLPPGSRAAGDLVQLVGGDAHLDEIAGLAGTISYELLTGLGARLERCYRGAV